MTDVDCVECGGNDEHPRGHCTWCSVVIDVLWDIHDEIRKAKGRRLSEASDRKLKKLAAKVSDLVWPDPPKER